MLKFRNTILFFIISFAFLCCKKDLKKKHLIFKDELRDTSNFTLVTSDTVGQSCDFMTPVFTVERKNDILDFIATGYDGRAVAKFPLSDLAPELKGLKSYSVKLRFKGEFNSNKPRFGVGPIIRLAHEKVFYYDPSQDEVIERQLKSPKSLTFRVDRALSNYQVRMDGDRNVTEFFKLGKGGASDQVVLTVGAEGGRDRLLNCDSSSIQLDAVKVYAR